MGFQQQELRGSSCWLPHPETVTKQVQLEGMGSGDSAERQMRVWRNISGFELISWLAD